MDPGMRFGCFEEEKTLLTPSRIKAVFCNYAVGKIATVGNMLVVTCEETVWNRMLVRLSTWSCLEVRMQDEVTT